MAKKKAGRQARSNLEQPRFFSAITPAETRQIIEHLTEVFFFGDGLVDPNTNNGADLDKLKGAKWFRLAANVAGGLGHLKNRVQWKGSVLYTALEMAKNDWRTRHGYGDRQPVIYKINHQAMGAQLAWARARGANV